MSRPITVLELSEALEKMLQEGKGDYPICVAFHWGGDTVVSDIATWNLNGKSIQLNEMDFNWKCYREGIGKVQGELTDGRRKNL